MREREIENSARTLLCVCVDVRQMVGDRYGVAAISRLLKVIVPFAEHSLFYRALLQMRPII